jgi:hypothetical protein
VNLSGSNFAFGQRDLRLTVSAGGRLVLRNWFEQARIDGRIEFADGTWNAQT